MRTLSASVDPMQKHPAEAGAGSEMSPGNISVRGIRFAVGGVAGALDDGTPVDRISGRLGAAGPKSKHSSSETDREAQRSVATTSGTTSSIMP